MVYAETFHAIDLSGGIGHNMGQDGYMRNKAKEENKDYISAGPAATIMRMSRTNLWRLTNDGVIPVVGFVPEYHKSGEVKYRAIYSKIELEELRAEWDRRGWEQRGIHIKRRIKPEPDKAAS